MTTESSPNRILPGALEGAYAAVLAQNAFLASKVIASMVGTTPMFSHAVLLATSMINFFVIAVSWLEGLEGSDGQTKYSKAHLFWDLLTVATLFVLSQSLIELVGKGITASARSTLVLIGLFYAILSLVHIAWNIVELRNSPDSKSDREIQRLRSAIQQNYPAFILAVGLLASAQRNHSSIATVILYWSWFSVWSVVLAIYVKTNGLLGNRPLKLVPTHRSKARWLGSRRRQLKQVFVSVRSRLTSPFARYTEGAAIRYFKNLYEGKTIDPLVFDGDDSSYFERLRDLRSTEALADCRIADIGCGPARFYQWIVSQGMHPRLYVGIDPAMQPRTLSQDAHVYCVNVSDEYAESLISSCDTVFCSNSICYMTDKQLLRLVEVAANAREFVAVEPVPGIFWDAHFDGVKLHYRQPEQLLRMLSFAGFKVHHLALDYRFSVAGVLFMPLSYMLVATRGDAA